LQCRFFSGTQITAQAVSVPAGFRFIPYEMQLYASASRLLHVTFFVLERALKTIRQVRTGNAAVLVWRSRQVDANGVQKHFE
jgi:hypothetical protein